MTLWFVARSAGFVALLAATATVTLGAAGTASSADRRMVAQLVHRSAAVLALAMLGLHVSLLVTDRFVDVTPAGALLPFTAGYRGAALGLGTIALYGLVALAATGSLRGRMAVSVAAARVWRATHLTAYAVWALAMAHGLLAGTDTRAPWALLLYATSGAVVACAAASRVCAEVRHRRRPLTVARHAALRSRRGVPTGASR